jgi:hypothetical protein
MVAGTVTVLVDKVASALEAAATWFGLSPDFCLCRAARRSYNGAFPY